MKRIVFLSMMLLSFYCTEKSCSEENDQSKCQSHTMESQYNYLSCFKFEDEEAVTKCKSFFINEKSQKIFAKLMKGYQKEKISKYKVSEIQHDRTIVKYEKETYSRDDTIKVIEVNLLESLTAEDKNIINNQNTCHYRSIARFDVNYIDETKVNISDKNICFNVDRFEELKDVLDCGYATIKGKYNNKEFAFTNCFLGLDKKADSEFQKYYKAFLSETYFKYHCVDVIPNFIERTGRFLDANDNTGGKFNAEEMQEFEIVVEDRSGNKIKYNIKGEIIEEIPADNTDNVNNEEKKNLSSSRITLNILILVILVFIS